MANDRSVEGVGNELSRRARHARIVRRFVIRERWIAEYLRDGDGWRYAGPFGGRLRGGWHGLIVDGRIRIQPTRWWGPGRFDHTRDVG